MFPASSRQRKQGRPGSTKPEKEGRGRKRKDQDIEVVDLIDHSSDEDGDALNSTLPTSFDDTFQLDGRDGDHTHGAARQEMVQHRFGRIGSHSRYPSVHDEPSQRQGGIRSNNPSGRQLLPPPNSGRVRSLLARQRPPGSMGALHKPLTTPPHPNGQYKKRGRAGSILSADRVKSRLGPRKTASAPNATSSEVETIIPRTPNLFQPRSETPNSTNRKLRNGAVMGAGSIIRSSGTGMMTLGSQDKKRKSSLSGFQPEIVMASHYDDDNNAVSVLQKTPPRAGSASEDEESSYDVISIADDSDEDVPDDAFSTPRESTQHVPLRPVNLAALLEGSARVTIDEPRAVASSVAKHLAPFDIKESRKLSARLLVKDSTHGSSHDVVSIADTSDDDVEVFAPDEARDLNHFWQSPSCTMSVHGEKSDEQLANDELTSSTGKKTDLSAQGLVESETPCSRAGLGDSQPNLRPDEQCEIAENPTVMSSAAESCSLDMLNIKRTAQALAKQNGTGSTKVTHNEVTSHAPVLSEVPGVVQNVQNVERDDTQSDHDTRMYGTSQEDSITQRLLLSCARPVETNQVDTTSIEETKENAQAASSGGSQTYQHDTGVGNSQGSEAMSLDVVSHSHDSGGRIVFEGDDSSPRGECTDRNSGSEGEGDLALVGGLSSWQLQDLLKPPPLDRIHEFEFLLKSSEKKSQWLRDIEKTPGVNVIEEWSNMAKRLRDWQQNEVEMEPADEQTSDSSSHSECETNNALQVALEEDMKFRGRRDGPVDISEDVGSRGVMRSVPMLDETYYNQSTGLPARKFSVVSSSDSCLYSFLLEARKSSLPNAGMGLFLQFLGAKEMKPSKLKRSIEISDLRHNIDHPHDELQAIHSEGFGIHVSVSGEHIKSRYNSSFPLKKLRAILPQNVDSSNNRRHTMKITFSDPDLPYDEDELRGLQKPEDYIGHLRLCTIDDYVDAPMRRFSSLYPECGFVDIGRYGPFRKEDRKFEFHFQAKSFVFGFEPSMWGFGVQENIWGREQTVDITDDVTGEPHETAQRNLSMYVNEVGHANLEETVHACEENDRVIKYFFVIRKPMKKGEKIELFVNYGSRYESNRERKGYGKANLANQEKGDDHFPSRLRRNFPEREHLILDVEESRMCDFAMIMEFCASLAKPLHDLLDSFLRSCTSSVIAVSPITAKQVIAVRRLAWMSSIFQARLDAMQNNSHRPVDEPGIMDDLYTFQCSEYLPRMTWMKWNELVSMLDENRGIKDERGNIIWDELCCEAIEEICFKVRDKIVLPCDASRWCPIAVEVTQNLCVAIAKSLWARKNGSSIEVLSQQFLEIAKKAADEIKDKATPSRLAFNKDFEDLFIFDELGSESIAAKAERIIVTMRNPFEGDKSASPVLIGCRSAFDARQDQREVIHTTWYLARQVFFLVDAIAQVTLEGESNYSRELLLTTIGLDAQTASLALDKVVIPPRGRQVDNNDYPRYNPTKQHASKPRKGSVEGSTKSKGADRIEKENSSMFWNIIWPVLKEEHGWTLAHGTRPQDFFACPRDVVKGKNGFRNRIDYFDSVPLIIKYLKTDSTWSTNPDVQRSVDEYDRCFSLYKNIRGTKALPKFQDRKEQIQWLREQVKLLK